LTPYLRRVLQRNYEVELKCIHGWTSHRLSFLGVPLASFIRDVCAPADEWRFIHFTGADGYSSVLHRSDAEAADAFIAVRMGDSSLVPRELGGIRVMLPSQYAFKSVKMLRTVSFEEELRVGFWERLGLHVRARWHLGERLDLSCGYHWLLGACYVAAHLVSRAVRCLLGEKLWRHALPHAHRVSAGLLSRAHEIGEALLPGLRSWFWLPSMSGDRAGRAPSPALITGQGDETQRPLLSSGAGGPHRRAAPSESAAREVELVARVRRITSQPEAPDPNAKAADLTREGAPAPRYGCLLFILIRKGEGGGTTLLL